MAKVIQLDKVMIDAETGQMFPVTAIIPEARDKGFTKCFDLYSSKLLDELDVINGELKLLNFLQASMMTLPLNSEGWIYLDRKAVSQKLGITIRTLQKYLTSLRQRGYIEQDRARGYYWRIKPELMFRGSLCRYFEEKSNEKISKKGVYIDENPERKNPGFMRVPGFGKGM